MTSNAEHEVATPVEINGHRYTLHARIRNGVEAVVSGLSLADPAQGIAMPEFEITDIMGLKVVEQLKVVALSAPAIRPSRQVFGARSMALRAGLLSLIV